MAKRGTSPPTTPPRHLDPIEERVVQKFRIYWKTTGARQEVMGREAGVKQTSISNLLLGKHGLKTFSAYERLANFFGTTLSELLADAPRRPEDPLLLRLRVALATLPPPARAAWVRNALMLAGIPEMAEPSADAFVAPTPPTTPRTRKTARAK